MSDANFRYVSTGALMLVGFALLASLIGGVTVMAKHASIASIMPFDTGTTLLPVLAAMGRKAS
jgi:heme A synthase